MEAQIKHLRDPSTYSEPIEIDDTSSSDDDTDLEVVPDELPPSEQLHDAEDDDPKFSDKEELMMPLDCLRIYLRNLVEKRPRRKH